MEFSNKIYCYLHMGGKLIKNGDGNVKYKGGRREDILINRGITYHGFVVRACEKMNITQ